MSYESIILLSNLSAEGEFLTEKSPGSGYHRQYDNLHTFFISLNSFQGEIKFQGTLNLYPNDNNDWFDIKDLDENIISIGDNSSISFDNSSYSFNSRGNFVWIRAVGSLSSGEISEIRYNY
jgi:hypothetical protein